MKLPTLRLAVLTLGLLCCSAGAARAQSKDVAKFFPDSTQMVFSVNVKSLLASPIFQKHFKEELEKKIKENEQFHKLLETAGFDLMRDLTHVSVTLNKFDIVFGGAPPDVDMFVVVKGAFNAEKVNSVLGSLIAAANQGDRFSSSRYGDFTLFEGKDPRNGKSFYGTIFDKETVILGNVKQQVTDAIERGLGKKTGALNGKFSELMGRARVDASFWGAILIPKSVKDLTRMAPNAEAGEVFAKLDSVTLKVDVKDNVKFDYSMFMLDEASAKRLKELIDQAREGLGVAALASEQLGSELGDFVNSIQVASNDKKVSVSGEAKADLVDKAIKMAKERGR